MLVLHFFAIRLFLSKMNMGLALFSYVEFVVLAFVFWRFGICIFLFYFVFLRFWIRIFLYVFCIFCKNTKNTKIRKYTLYSCISLYFSIASKNVLCQNALCPLHFVKNQHRTSTNVCCISILLIISLPSWLHFFCNLVCIVFVFLFVISNAYRC